MVRHLFAISLFLVILLLIAVSTFITPSIKANFVGITTVRVSVASNGTQSNNLSEYAKISGDGRYVVFDSLGTNLVSGDTNNSKDIFVHDRHMSETQRVSLATDGGQGNADSVRANINVDGHYITFASLASNIVSNDTNGVLDIFLRDLTTGVTERVSISDEEIEANNTSDSWHTLSANGRYIVFASLATNLVPNDTNGKYDIFVRDRLAQTTERISVSSAGNQGNDDSRYPSISADGRYIVYASLANNLVPNDTNAVWDAFLYDRQNATTIRVSVGSGGTEANAGVAFPKISPDGRYIAFSTPASNIVGGDTNGEYDVFLYDRVTINTVRISLGVGGVEANNDSVNPEISWDGSYIAYSAQASNLVLGDTNGQQDIFLYDRQKNETIRISISSSGTESNGFSNYYPDISDDGSIVSFDSYASNLVGGDTNTFCDTDSDGSFDDNCPDIFVREWTIVPPTITPTPTSTPSPTLTPTPTFTATQTPTPSATSLPPTVTITVTPQEEASLTPTPTYTATDTPATPTITQTGTIPTVTQTVTAGASPTPTATSTNEIDSLNLPLVLRLVPTPLPPTVTPTPTVPVCEALDREPNNFFSQANANLPLCEGGIVAGSVSSNDIDDYYRFQLDNATTVRIDLTGIPTGADYDLYLYDASGGPVTVSNNSGSVNETIRTQLASGRYYIRIYSLNYADPNTYQLRWSRD